jgi:hypothetical protein
MGEYDVTLRHLTRIGGRTFLREMGVDGRLTPVQTDFPNTRDRQVDFLGILDRPDGVRLLLHIEFQSAPDVTMPSRMLGYYSDILAWLTERKGDRHGALPREVMQKVVYVGSARWDPETSIRHPNLQFRFEFADIFTLSSSPLLEAGDLGDAVVAILCADGTSQNVIRAILTKIARAPENARADALAQLVALSGLRGIRPLIEQEYKAMGIVVDVSDSTLLREPIDRARAEGKAEGKAEAIERILQQRFPGHVPAGLIDHLAGIDPAILDEVLDKSMTAASVDDALGANTPARAPGRKR